MKVRTAQPLDIPAIFALGLRMQARGAFAYTTLHFPTVSSRCLDAIFSESMWLGVTEHEGVIVAALFLIHQRYWWSKDEYFVIDDGLYSDHAGAGVPLIRAGMKWAAAKAPKEITLTINSDIDMDRTVRTLNRIGLHDRGINVSMRMDNAEVRRWAA